MIISNNINEGINTMIKLFDSRGNTTIFGAYILELILQADSNVRASMLYQVGKEFGQGTQEAMVDAINIILS